MEDSGGVLDNIDRGAAAQATISDHDAGQGATAPLIGPNASATDSNDVSEATDNKESGGEERAGGRRWWH